MYYIAELSVNPSDSMQYLNVLFSTAYYMIFLSLQVHFTSGGVKLLALAEALLKKHINSHSLHEPEGISDFNALCDISYPFVFPYTDVVLS
jgi:hypothetical protein